MFLALKELKHGKLRFFMIGLILVLISWLVFILSGLGNGLSTLSASAFKNMNADYVVFEKGSKNSMSRTIISEDLVTSLNNFKNVKDVESMGYAMGTFLKGNTKAKEEKTDITILGVNPGGFLVPKVIEGKTISDRYPNEVIVNDTLKDKGFKLGDQIELEGTVEKVKIVGFVQNQTYNHVPAVYTTMDKWRTIHFAAPGSDKGIKHPVNAIMLQGKNINIDAINKKFSSYDIVTKADAIQGLPGYKEENGSIMMMLTFCIAISAVVIAVFFYVLTLQKSNQFGIMKAIGASNSFLGKTIVAQVFVLSLISILIGIALTYLTAFILPEGMPFTLSTNLVINYSIVLLIISILASLVSVRKITKIDPLQAIGRVE